MLDYGINFNVEEGAKKAQKELEEWNKRWQNILKNNPLKVDFSGVNFDDLVKNTNDFSSRLSTIKDQTSGLQKDLPNIRLGDGIKEDGRSAVDVFNKLKQEAAQYGKALDSVGEGTKAPDKLKTIGGQVAELRKMFRELELGEKLEEDGDAIIAMFKNLKQEAGKYGESLDSIVKKETEASSESLSIKLKLLSDRWKDLSLSQRKGAEGAEIINQFRSLSAEADIYAGSLSKVASAQNALAQSKTVNQQLSELTQQWDNLSIAQRRGSEGRAVINAFKEMTNAAGVYIGSIQSVIAEEERLAKQDPLKGRMINLEKQWDILSVEQRRGAEGRKILDNYKQVQESAGVYLGSINQVLAEEKRIAAEAEKKKAIQEKSTVEIEKQNSTLKRQSDIMVQLKSYAMNFLSVYAGIRLTKNMVAITGEFEAQRMSLQAILRDAKQGEAIFERIKELAVMSPYTFKDLVSYTKQLSAFSVPYEELYDTTKMLADAAAGLGVDMSRIILAYGQVRAASVLRGQELRQFTEAGIPLVDELAKKFTELKGEVVSASDVFDLISQRQVPFEMIKDILTEMTSEGGKFYQMQEKLADTLKGKVANLTDAFQIMLAEIGEKGDGVLKGSIDSTRWLIENYEKAGRILLTLASTYGGYRAAVALTTTAELFLNGTYVAKIRLLRLAVATQNLLNKAMLANPYVIAGAALAGLITYVYLYKKGVDAAASATENWNNLIDKQKDAAEKEKSKISELINTIKDETATRVQKETALKDLQDIMPSVFNDMDVEAVKLMNLTELMKAYNLSAEERNHILRKQAVEEGRSLLNEKEGAWRWSMADRKKALELMGKPSSHFAIVSTPVNDLIDEFSEWVKQGEKSVKDFEAVLEDIAGDPIKYDTFQGLIKALSEAEAKLKDLQDQAREGIIPTEDVKAQQEVISKLKENLFLMGWEESKAGDASKAKKDAEKRMKDFLDGIQSQVEEYREKFNIWNTIYESSGKQPSIDFDITFDGEPDLTKYIKAKMQEIAGGKLSLDVDFLTADFSDILGGSSFDEQTIDKLKSLFDELRSTSFSEYKELAQLYDQYASYTIKKANLDKKYYSERRKLVESGASADILKEQTRVYEEEADKLMMGFAEKDKAFNDFVTSIANQSVDKLRFLLMELQASLVQENATGENEEVILMLRAKISALEEQLKNAKIDTSQSKDIKDSYRQWRNLESVLNRVGKSFDEIGDSVGGLTGEIISLAGDITTSTLSMINGITTLANWSIQATKMAAEGVSKSIQAVEKASVILAVISAAMQVASKVWGFITRTDELSQKKIEQYNALIKVTNEVIDSQKKLISTMSGAEAKKEQEETLRLLEKQKQAAIDLGKEYMGSGSGLFKRSYGVRMQRDLEKFSKDFAKIGINYGSLGRGLAGLFDLTPEQLKNIKKEIPGFWAGLNEETREYLEQIIEIGEKTAELGDITKEAFTGIEFDSIHDGLDEFITSADSDLSMVAENFEEYMTTALLNIIKTQFLTNALQGWYDEFSKRMEDGTLSAEDVEYLRNMYTSIAQDAKNQYDYAKEIAGIQSKSDSNLTGLSKSVASLTEDTALILGGYLNSIRDKLFPYIDYMMAEHRTTMSDMLITQRSMAAYLVAIEGNTKRTAESNDKLLDRIDRVFVASDSGKGFAINVNA